MADLDRAALIETLARLGAESDEIVLEAARAAHRQLTEVGRNWNEIIVPVAALTAQDAADAHGTEGEPDIGRQIDWLIRKGVSDTLRDDLIDMKRQLAAGTLDPDDARYVDALARRLKS
jgi:hypothetical protein